MRTFKAACARLGVRPWRDDVRANSGADAIGFQRENLILTLILIDIWQHMRPRSNADRIAGRPAKPASALAVITAVRRVHESAGIAMAPAPTIGPIVRGMYKRLKREFAVEYLIPDRKEPFPGALIRQLFSVPNGTVCSGVTVDWSSLTFIAFRAANALARATGFRKDEVSLPDGESFCLGRASCANLAWLIGGVRYVAPTHAQLRNLGPSDMVSFVAPALKADQFALHWGSTPIHLVASADTLNAVTAPRDYELAVSVPPAQRRGTPLFVVSAARAPLRH